MLSDGHTEGDTQVVAQVARLLLLVPRLQFLSLEGHIA